MKHIFLVLISFMSLQTQALQTSEKSMRDSLNGTYKGLASGQKDPGAIGMFTFYTVGSVSFGPAVSTMVIQDNTAKLVVEAKEDAALFVASEGEVRTANLDQALQALREAAPADLRISDLEIAQSILLF